MLPIIFIFLFVGGLFFSLVFFGNATERLFEIPTLLLALGMGFLENFRLLLIRGFRKENFQWFYV